MHAFFLPTVCLDGAARAELGLQRAGGPHAAQRARDLSAQAQARKALEGAGAATKSSHGAAFRG